MKYLSLMGLSVRCVCVATTVGSIVSHYDELKHVVMQSQGHLVERIYVSI